MFQQYLHRFIFQTFQYIIYRIVKQVFILFCIFSQFRISSTYYMGTVCCSGFTLGDDPFLQMQLLYCNQQIAPLRKMVNQTKVTDLSKTYKFGNWDPSYGMTGLGIIYLPKIFYYDGGIRKGKPHGNGRIIWTNTDTYHGDVSEGRASGTGKFNCSRRGIKYNGEWYNGFPSYGKLTFNNMTVDVEFKKNKQLKIKLPDGSVYAGDIARRNNEFIIQGKGRLTFPDGSYYDGHWKEGHMHGRGDYVWKSGQRYRGDYQIGKKQGYGVYYFTPNDWYEGMWQDGKQHGDGTIFVNGQKAYNGRWLQGNPDINVMMH